MTMNRILVGAFVLAVAASANAITFSNVIITSTPLSDGSSYAANGNAISFNLPNAIVGDGVGVRAGTLNIQYDVDAGALANGVGANVGVVALGTGAIAFRESVIELDNLGNEIGGIIGSASFNFNASTPMYYSTTIALTQAVRYLRVKKSFTLVAPDSQAFDLAAVAIVNQNVQVVPEPGTIAALSLGAAALLRRRRK